VVAGNLVDGAPPVWPGAIVVTTEAQGRAVVDSLVQAGAGFVKVYSRLAPAVYFAMLDEARRKGIAVAGHVPNLVRASDASDSGQRSMEHLTGVLDECSRDPGAVLARRRWIADALTRSVPLAEIDSANRAVLAIVADERDDRRCGELLARLARNGTWQVPTLTVLRGQALAPELAGRDDPRFKYISRRLRESWEPARNRFLRARTGEDWHLWRRVFARQLELVGLMQRAGVPLLAGTDASNPYALPGFGIHDELELLVRAGLDPREALRAATLNPARYFGATDSLGTVEAGKLADLVLLDADPLQDIRHAERIRAVVVGGHYLDRRALDALLERAEQLANPLPVRP
jgi:imidazolonepropionase-like amidohydrolase